MHESTTTVIISAPPGYQDLLFRLCSQSISRMSQGMPAGAVELRDMGLRSLLRTSGRRSWGASIVWSEVGYDPRYRGIERLGPQDEMRFVALSKAGDSFARQKLTLHYLPLLRSVALLYRGHGLSTSELVNEGTFGLSRAIDRFDFGRHRCHAADEAGILIAIRIGREQALDIRQQHQAISRRHLCDARAQPIVIAVADFGGSHGVIFIHHRQCA